MELIKIQNRTNKFYYKNLLKISKKRKLKSDFLENKINDLDNNISSISETDTITKVKTDVIYSDDYYIKNHGQEFLKYIR